MLRKKTQKAILCFTGVCIVVLGITGCYGNPFKDFFASQPRQVILKLGTETALESPETRGALKLAELVREKSQGTLAIEVFENAKLGIMKERLEGMRMGTIDMGTSSVGFLASYAPVLGIFDLPYVFKDKAHEFRVFDSEIGQEVDKKIQAQGLRVVCYFDNGVRQITNNRRPIFIPADLKGLRIRVPQTEASMEGLRIFGAIPTPMAFNEVYMAIKQNVVDGQENPLPLIDSMQLHEVQKYLSLTNHQHFIQVLTISEKSWQKLSPAQQKTLMECAKSAQVYQREIAEEEEKRLVKVLQSKGMQINQVKDVNEFVEQAKSLRGIYIKRLGQPAKELLGQIDDLRN